MSEFAAVIKYKFDNEEVSALVLDTIEDVSINSPTQITTQPMVNGDEISDHQFQQPKTLTISGSCSLNGSQSLVVSGSGSKLANIQEIFEKIQREAVLCDIYKISVNNDKDIRFKQRTNMALQSISWTEKINSMDFVLSFREVLLSEVVEYDVDIDDNNLPNVTEPTTTSFTNSLIDWEEIDGTIIQIIERETLWTTEFKTFLQSLNQEGIIAMYVTATAAALIVAAICVAGGPVGWIIGAAIVAVGAVVMVGKFIWDAVQKAKRRKKYAVEQFQYYKNKNKDQKELERFSDLLYDIHQEFNALNDKIKVYQLSVEGNQEAMISIGNDYHIFTFTQNNTNNTYSLRTENVDKTITSNFPDLKCAVENIGQMTSSNYLFKAANNARVYLVNPSEDKDTLTNYMIVVCDFNPDDLKDMITKIIENKIYRNAGG